MAWLTALMCLVIVLVSSGSTSTAIAMGEEPGALIIHPDNPKYFLFRKRPLVLVTATEHYGSVINRPFDYEKYLDDMVDKRMTLTRTFLLYRELQTARNPSSPCKPESPDFIAPFLRTGPAKALDGEPVYDLDQLNPEYFSRLNRFLRLASKRGIVVELTLFSNTYSDLVWSLNPLRAENNKQRIGNIEWPEYTSRKNRPLFERQVMFARKIVAETSQFDNIYYEICNEPAGNQPNHVAQAEVESWLTDLAGVVREELLKRGRKRLVFGAEPFNLARRAQELKKTFSGRIWDAVNIHPSQYLFWEGRNYNLGGFMARDLKLFGVRDFCLSLGTQPRPVVIDEDNTASLYRDRIGWEIHRKRAWTAVFSGAHYDYIDFSITVGSESGTRASRGGIRAWMKNLSLFIQSFDFIHAKPGSDWIATTAVPLVISGLAVEGKDYVAYLADGREQIDPAAGQPIDTSISLNLPAGSFQIRLFSPVEGQYSPGITVVGGKTSSIQLGPFRNDLVVRVSRTR